MLVGIESCTDDPPRKVSCVQFFERVTISYGHIARVM